MDMRKMVADINKAAIITAESMEINYVQRVHKKKSKSTTNICAISDRSHKIREKVKEVNKSKVRMKEWLTLF